MAGMGGVYLSLSLARALSLPLSPCRSILLALSLALYHTLSLSLRPEVLTMAGMGGGDLSLLLALSLPLSPCRSISLALSLALSHTHTHTRTHALSQTSSVDDGRHGRR